MIAAMAAVPKGTWIRAAQLAAMILALFAVVFFLRHSLTTSATSFRLDFERQSFIELSRGETFLIARKLAALAKGAQINCVVATKGKTVFFEETKGLCSPGFFRSVQVIKEPNQEIEVSFTIRLQDELFYGFLVFLTLQAALAAFTLLAQRQALLAEHRHDLDLANLARQVGHDIRSPLAVLSHFHRGKDSDPSVARRAIGRLDELVGHLLSDPIAQTSAKESIGILLSEAAQEKKIEFGEKVEIQFFIDDSLENHCPPGDSFMWRRLFSNLLNNSIEAARGEKVVVEMTAKKSEQGWAVEVKDNGRGIPPEVLARVGEKGFSFGKGRVSGLGLSSAKEFVSVNGGSLEVVSQEGSGTTITIRFATATEVLVVLIDDDAEIGALWQRVAKRVGANFVHFLSPEDFLGVKDIPRSASIYLDIEFKNSSQDGLSFGAELKERGFEKIFLATGHSREQFRGLSWVSGVVGKEPPWEI